MREAWIEGVAAAEGIKRFAKLQTLGRFEGLASGGGTRRERLALVERVYRQAHHDGVQLGLQLATNELSEALQ